MTSDSPISSLNEPWLQLPPKAGKGGATETLINHEAFLIYRDLPPSEQSIARVAQSLGKNEKLLEKWSSKFFWRERASAWRRRLQEIEAEERQQQAREQEQRRIQREQEFHE